jgi:hypothetical protein
MGHRLLEFQSPSQRKAAAEVLSLAAPDRKLAQRQERLAQRRCGGFEAACDFSVVERAPKPVRADEKYVAGLNRLAPRDRHVRQNRIAAETGLDEIAHRMHLHLLDGDEPLAQQEFHMTVIAGARDEPAVAQMIDATVADVRPPCRALLHEAHRAGCARPLLEGQMSPELHDLLMCPAERHMQKAERVK